MLLAGRYELGAVLGEGGMGVVYHGVDTHTKESVAIKQLKPEIVASEPSLVTRFIREGEMLRQLNHPNIVKMLATLEDNNHHYLVMEFVTGGSLFDVLKVDASLSVRRTLEIGLDLSDALTRAHRLNIVHRDIKPANVLIADDGTPRLTDFGVAQMRERERVTKTDSVVGTLSYLSPEAFMDQKLDARSDIWAFGIMLCEMLTGKRPFDRETVGATVMAIVNDPVPDIELLRPDLPIALVDLIYRMLEKDPSQRIPSVRLVGAALEALMQEADSVSYKVHMPLTPKPAFDTPTPVGNTPPNNLPASPTPFVGRESELEALAKLLIDTQTRMITIAAPGGMGKTRLALESARRTLEQQGLRFEDGIFLIELAPISAEQHIVLTTADAIGFQFYAGGTPQQQLLDYLREKHMLLVMDNFEHVLAGTALISEILQTAPNVKIIATSRERLNLRGETVFTISGMDFPDWETPEDALQYGAIKLFMHSARRATPAFELDAKDLTYVARICRLVYGMPLGIELAASWVGMLPLYEIADEISKSLDFLETEMRDMPERHRSIRAVFDYSWSLLTADEQTMFAKCAVFRGGFSRQAVQTIVGANLRQLSSLVNKSLLRRNPESGDYQVHELLRQYAEEKLETSGEMNAVRDAHSDYYLNVVHQRAKDLEGGRQIEASKEIESDIENIQTGWIWAAQRGRLTALDKAVHGLWLYYDLRSQYTIGETVYEQAVDEIRKQPTSPARDNLLGFLLACEAAFAVVLFEGEKSDKLLQDSQALVKATGTPETRAMWAFAQGYAHMTLKSTPDARPYFEEALTIYRQLGDRWGCSHTLLNLGRSYWYRTDLKSMDLSKAKMFLEEALAIQKELGDVYHMAFALGNLGSVAAYRNEEARDPLTHEALALHRMIGNSRGVSNALNNLGISALFAGRYAEAKSYLDEALAIEIESGSPVSISWALTNLSGWAYCQGEFAQSRGYLERALATLERSDNKEWLGDTLFFLGSTALAEGRYEDSKNYWQRRHKIVEDSLRHFLPNSYLNFARLAIAQQKFAEARTYLERCLQTAQEQDDQSTHADGRRVLGMLEYFEGHYSEAREVLLASLAYSQNQSAQQVSYQRNPWESQRVLVEGLSILADVERAEGDYAAAWQHFREGLTTARRLPSICHMLMVLAGIAELLAVQSQTERAVEFAALVSGHRNAYAVDKARAASLLDTLRTSLAAEVFNAAVERSTTLDVEAVVQSIVAE